MRMILFFVILYIPTVIFAQMTEREQQVLDEINLVREHPADYIKYIDPFLEYWNSSAEEKATAEELKKELKKLQPLQPLVFSPELYASARKHGEYIAKTGKFVHSDCNCGENIQYGNSEVRNAVIDLLIDNGVPERGHRKNILNSEYKYFAVYEITKTVGDMDYIFIQQFDW